MATIRTRKRGKTWSYSFEIGKNPETGRRKMKEKGGFATQDEAYDAGVEAYADWKHGNIGLTSDKVLLDDFFKIWLDKRRQPYRQKEGRVLFSTFLVRLSGRRRLRHRLAEYQLDDVDAALHQQRKDHTIADLAPARLRLCLLLCGRAEAVHRILNHGHDLAQQRSRHVLFDVFGHVVDMQCVYDIVSYICPFRHFNHPFLHRLGNNKKYTRAPSCAARIEFDAHPSAPHASIRTCEHGALLLRRETGLSTHDARPLTNEKKQEHLLT